MLAPPRAPSPLSGAVIAAALAHARQGRPAVVAAESPDTPPTALPACTQAVVWRTPDGAQWIGLGEAARFAAEGLADAAQMPAACQALLAEGVFGTEAARSLLRGFGGLAFDAHDDRPAPLSAPSPISAFWVPEALWVVVADGVCRRVVTVPVQAEDDEQSVASRWTAAVAQADAWHGTIEVPGPRYALTAPDPTPWHAAVRTALDTIEQGALEKVVLARAIALEAVDVARPFGLWRALSDRAPHTHRFLFAFPDGSAFLGASPERLFALEGSALTLDGLAGTAPRDSDPVRDAALGAALLANDKDCREHAFVVRAIADVLAPLVETLTYPERPTLKRLPNVQHLHTPLTGTLRTGLGLETLLTALHPTPAVGGTPRQAAIEAIRALEPNGRGWYAGPVGWVAADAAEFAVAIRSTYLVGHQAAVMAGAGIVAGSTPDGEWDETARKAAPLLKLLTEDRA